MTVAVNPIATTKAEQKMDKRLGAVRSVFEKLARIITGNRKVGVSMVRPSMNPYVRTQVPAGTPGWTDGERVFLNSDVLRGLAEASDFGTMLMRAKGVFYHEVAHILYTPRTTTEPAGEILRRSGATRNGRHTGVQSDPSWWWAFNALEDQRIETLFASVYGQSKRYFEAAALEWLVKPDTELGLAHMLVHGRKYLAPEVRQAAREAFVNHIGGAMAERYAGEADRIIDAYLALEYPRDGQKGLTLVRQYRDLMAKVGLTSQHPQPSMDNSPSDPPDSNGEQVIKKGRPSSDRQKEAQKDRAEKPDPVPPKPKKEGTDDPKPKAKDEEEDADEANDFPPKDDEGNVEGTDSEEGDDVSEESDAQQGDDDTGDATTETDDTGEADGDGDDAQEGDEADAEGEATDGGDGDGEASQGESSGTGNDPSGTGDGHGDSDGGSEGSDTGPSSDSGDGVGTGSGTATMTAEEFVEMIEAAIEVLMSDEDFAADLDATVEAVIMASGADDGLDGGYAPFRDVTIPTAGRSTVRKISTELAQLRLELDDFRESRQAAGRFNVRDAMVAQPFEVNVFNRWHPGDEEAGGFEAVMLLDLSGSMAGARLAEASLAMWCLKRAFDELNIRTTVLGYSDAWSILYRPGEKASKGDMRLFGDQGGTSPYDALRHAYRILSTSQSQNRLLVSVTDGGWSNHGGDPDEAVQAISNIEGCTTLLVGINDPSYPMYRCVESYGTHNHHIAIDLDGAAELPLVVNALVKRMMRKAITGVHLHG